MISGVTIVASELQDMLEESERNENAVELLEEGFTPDDICGMLAMNRSEILEAWQFHHGLPWPFKFTQD